MRQITYSVASEARGAYNGTFRWDRLQAYFDFLSRYWDVQFVRNNNGRVKVYQAGKLNGNAVAWTNIPSFTIRISPTFNFGRNDYYCAKVLLHEFMHCSGGAAHLPGNVALMSVAGGTAGNITQADYRYMAPYAWKSAARPHNEPQAMQQAFTAMKGVESFEPEPPVFGCGCKSSWIPTWSVP